MLFRFTKTHNFISTFRNYIINRDFPYSCFFAASPISPFLLSEEFGAGFGAGATVAAGASAGVGAVAGGADGGTGADADTDAGAGGIAATVGPGRGGIDGRYTLGGAGAGADAGADADAADVTTDCLAKSWRNMAMLASMFAAAARAAASAAAMVGSSEEDALDSFRFLLYRGNNSCFLPFILIPALFFNRNSRFYRSTNGRAFWNPST